MLVSTKLTVILHVAVSLALTTKFEAIGPSVNGAVISDLLTGVDPSIVAVHDTEYFNSSACVLGADPTKSVSASLKVLTTSFQEIVVAHHLLLKITVI